MKALNQVINTKSADARWQWRVLRASKFDDTHATRSTRRNEIVVRRIGGGTEKEKTATRKTRDAKNVDEKNPA
jgi:hypothetical protein